MRNIAYDKQQFSVRNIVPQLALSSTTVWMILRYDTNAKFYRPSTVQPLTEDHKEQRRIFCNWLLQQPDDFVQQVIWTDEKILVLNRRPNRKNDGTWRISRNSSSAWRSSLQPKEVQPSGASPRMLWREPGRVSTQMVVIFNTLFNRL